MNGGTPNEVIYTGFKPYSHQRAVIDELKDARKSGKVVVVKSSRQKGKSLLIENLLLYYAINYKCTSICVSPVLTQSRKIFQELTNAIEGSDLVRRKNETLLEIEFVTGSKILFKSAEQKESLRGYTVSGLLAIDECAFIDDDIFYKILPWVDVFKAPILMCSSPFVRNGFFFDYYSRGYDGGKIVSIDWCDKKYRKDIEKLLPPERLEEYRLALPHNQFKSEYLGEFLDDDGSVFTNFTECVKDHSIQPTDKLVVGIDWANQGGNDDTVMSIMNTRGEQVYLGYWNNLSSATQQIDKICAVLEPFRKQIVLIQPELNSIGEVYTDLLRKRLQTTNIQGFNTTNQSKETLVTNLQVAFENHRVDILGDEKQLKELSTYMAEYNLKTKKVSYNAPQGLHDDICIALMLSYDAYMKHRKTGNYVLSYC